MYQRYNQPTRPSTHSPGNVNNQSSPAHQNKPAADAQNLSRNHPSQPSEPHKKPSPQQPPRNGSVPHNNGGKAPHGDLHKQGPVASCQKAPVQKPSNTASYGGFSRPLSFSGILNNIIPKGFYNPDSKKILGFLSAEDLLIIALIFLFAENNEEDNPLIIIALVYILLSDYIDLGDFSF